MSLTASLVAMGLSARALANSITQTRDLTSCLQLVIDASAESLAFLQKPITSLAQVTLQNHQALDLLTAEKGGTCLFLKEECCYHVNESGLVETRVAALHKLSAELHQQKFSNDAISSWRSSMFSLFAPFLGPLLIICILLLLTPCFIEFLKIRFCEISSRHPPNAAPAVWPLPARSPTG
uniref:Uncharacterized protein n=1 Tax=Rousettus aegyptiacus TaxID=9407 RepID=A0A7J8CI96_ROUAE|nr:hypothetical protein HJG63_009077 [Rousettus aegyptiacus]